MKNPNHKSNLTERAGKEPAKAAIPSPSDNRCARVAFEAFWSSDCYEWEEMCAAYHQAWTDVAGNVLEEAARVCETDWYLRDAHLFARGTAEKIATAIRALKYSEHKSEVPEAMGSPCRHPIDIIRRHTMSEITDDDRWEEHFQQKRQAGMVVLTGDEWNEQLTNAYAEGRKDEAESSLKADANKKADIGRRLRGET